MLVVVLVVGWVARGKCTHLVEEKQSIAIIFSCSQNFVAHARPLRCVGY